MKRMNLDKRKAGTEKDGGAGAEKKWGYYHEALIRLHEHLVKAQRDKLAQAAEPLEPHSMSMADSATDEFTHDLALSQLSAGQDVLLEIEEALHRIQDGTYGICEVSGKRIPKERLRVMPWARYTRSVEQKLEKDGVVGHVRLGTLGSVKQVMEQQRDIPED